MVSDQCGTGATMNCWSVCVTAVNQSSPCGVVPRVVMAMESLLIGWCTATGVAGYSATAAVAGGDLATAGELLPLSNRRGYM